YWNSSPTSPDSIIWIRISGTRKRSTQRDATFEKRPHRDWFVPVGSRAAMLCFLRRITRAFGRLIRRGAGDEREVAKVFAVVETVADQDLVGGVETDPTGLQSQLRGEMLVEQRAQLERPGLPLPHQRHEPVQRRSAVDDVLHEDHVPIPDIRSGIVQEANLPGALRSAAIATGDQEIHLHGPCDLPDEVSDEDERPLQ